VVCGQWSIQTHDLQQEGFYKLQEQEDGIQVELGNDATYPVTKWALSLSCMPSSDVLELNDVLYVPNLTKNLLLVSCMTDLQCVVEFDDQQVIIRNTPNLVKFWPKELEGGLYSY
jgi:hypothetical protein